MRGWRHIVSCFAVLGALLLILPGVALATSAGDQQYIDPLAGSTTSSSSPPPASTHASAPSPAPAATPASSAASTTSAGSSPAASTTSAAVTPAAQSTAATLPYTGLNVWLCATVGLALVGAGWSVRRLTRAT